MATMDLLPRYLTLWRERAGVSQTEVAKALGVAAATVNRWERGTRAISVDQLFALSDYYNVPISALLRDPRDVSVDDILADQDDATRTEIARIVEAYLAARKNRT